MSLFPLNAWMSHILKSGCHYRAFERKYHWDMTTAMISNDLQYHLIPSLSSLINNKTDLVCKSRLLKLKMQTITGEMNIEITPIHLSVHLSLFCVSESALSPTSMCKKQTRRQYSLTLYKIYIFIQSLQVLRYFIHQLRFCLYWSKTPNNNTVPSSQSSVFTRGCAKSRVTILTRVFKIRNVGGKSLLK